MIYTACHAHYVAAWEAVFIVVCRWPNHYGLQYLKKYSKNGTKELLNQLEHGKITIR